MSRESLPITGNFQITVSRVEIKPALLIKYIEKLDGRGAVYSRKPSPILPM